MNCHGYEKDYAKYRGEIGRISQRGEDVEWSGVRRRGVQVKILNFESGTVFLNSTEEIAVLKNQ